MPLTPSLLGEPPQVAIPLLLREHGGRIYTIGLRLCGNPQTAEDLVQETFFQAFRKWHQFEGRSDPATWLYTIASRVCRRFHRRRAGEPSRIEPLSELLPSPDAGVPELPSQEEGPLEVQIRREAQERVAHAMATIPVHFRLPLVLKEIGDFSIAEIAKVLGLKEGTIKTRVHRGRLLLRKALTEQLPTRLAPPPDHSKQMCLDLLKLKQEALDRGTDFPLPPSELCDRCRSLFATLDYTHEVCLELRHGELPDSLHQLLLREFGTAA